MKQTAASSPCGKTILLSTDRTLRERRTPINIPKPDNANITQPGSNNSWPAFHRLSKSGCLDNSIRNNAEMSKKILYVDDDKAMLDLIKLLLEQAGYTAMTAQNVDEALRIAEGMLFGAMVIDVNLAGDSGVMLMNFMMHNHKGVPVILYSGLEHDQPKVDKLLALGASKFVQKHNGSELVTAVKQLCPPT
jgi:CheY-like chemotaxis protein